MDTKHTYRRWFATQHPDDKTRWFVQSDLMSGFDICEVSNYPKASNARLIAAAPDLLDAAVAFVTDVDSSDLDDLDYGRGLAQSGLIEAFRAAIAKATQP